MSKTKRKKLFKWGLAGLVIIFLFCLAIGATIDAPSLIAMPFIPFVFGMASKSVSFSQIPGGIKKPGIYIEQDTSLASHALPSTARKVLIIGQRLAAGTIAEKVPKQIFSEAEAATYFGAGSLAHLMARAAITRNPYIDLTVITLVDAVAGVAAAGMFTITGPATSAGTIRIWIGDQYVDAAIADDDTETAIAAAIVAAITAKADLPVTAGNVAGVVTVTAKNKGLCGNEIGLGYELTGAAGVACVIVAMAEGATNPALADALAPVYPTRFHIIVTPFNNQTDLGTLKTHIESVSNALEQRGAIGVYATTAALASATTLAGQVNSIRIAGAYVRYTASTQKKTPSFQIAALAAAGLSAIPDIAEPIKNMDMTGVALPAIADRFSRTEQETCLAGGVSPVEVGPGEAMRLVRMPTTYTTDPNSQTVFVDIHKITGMDYVRDAAISDLSAKAPKKIIKEGSPTTVDILRNIVRDVAYRCQEAGVLTGVTSYKDQFLVEEDLQNVGQMNILMPSPVVEGLYVVAVKQILY